MIFRYLRDINVLNETSFISRTIFQVVVLEKQYWILIDLPKQETSETQTDYITRSITVNIYFSLHS